MKKTRIRFFKFSDGKQNFLYSSIGLKSLFSAPCGEKMQSAIIKYDTALI
jgi:hypothetical protein